MTVIRNLKSTLILSAFPVNTIFFSSYLSRGKESLAIMIIIFIRGFSRQIFFSLKENRRFSPERDALHRGDSDWATLISD